MKLLIHFFVRIYSQENSHFKGWMHRKYEFICFIRLCFMFVFEFRNENSVNEGSMSWYDLENVKSFKEPFWCNGLFGANPENAGARIQVHALCFTRAYQRMEVKVELRNAHCVFIEILYHCTSIQTLSFLAEYTIFAFKE